MKDTIEKEKMNQYENKRDVAPRRRRRKKKGSPFKLFLLSYAGMWLVLTIVLCSVLWKNLSAYQNSYNEAEAAGRPELAIDEVMGLFEQDNIKQLIAENEPEILSRFESLEDYEQFYYDFIKGKSLSYVKNDQLYNDARPVYDIYADNMLLAMVSLKAKGEKDSFGFNKWEIRDIAISENYYEYHDVYLKVMDDMTVYINGIEVGEPEYVRGGVIENSITDMAYELTGVSFGYKVYYACDMIKEPVISVKDAGGNDVTDKYVVDENGLMNYETTASEEFTASVYERVKEFCETYVRHIYRKASVDAVAGMMEDGSQAEKLLYNAQSTLAWAWVPDNVEILDEAYDDFFYYDENYFSCRSTMHIRKSDENTVEDEEFVCRWLFKLVNGIWQVTYFVLE